MHASIIPQTPPQSHTRRSAMVCALQAHVLGSNIHQVELPWFRRATDKMELRHQEKFDGISKFWQIS
jgi:hypothetical protein